MIEEIKKLKIYEVINSFATQDCIYSDKIDVVSLKKVLEILEKCRSSVADMSQYKLAWEETIQWLQKEYMCFDNEEDECIIARAIIRHCKELEQKYNIGSDKDE